MYEIRKCSSFRKEVMKRKAKRVTLKHFEGLI